MKLIKKYWKLIAGAIAGILGLLFIFSKKNTTKKLEKTKKKIDNNNKEITKLDGKLEHEKQEKAKVKKTVKKYLAHVIWKKDISALKYLAIVSVKGKIAQERRLYEIAFTIN